MAAYRDDVDAIAARRTALLAEISDKQRELREASTLLAEAEGRARLPVLDNIRVASPCHADWAQMSGDERVRHCGACAKNVYDLSALTRVEAEALILEKEGRLCIRYFRRLDGTIMLKDCSVGRQRRWRWIAIGASAALVMGVGAVQRIDQESARIATRGVLSNLPLSPIPARKIRHGHVAGNMAALSVEHRPSEKASEGRPLLRHAKRVSEGSRR